MGKRNAIKRKYYKTRAAVEWEAHRSLRNRVVAIRPSLNILPTAAACLRKLEGFLEFIAAFYAF